MNKAYRFCKSVAPCRCCRDLDYKKFIKRKWRRLKAKQIQEQLM